MTVVVGGPSLSSPPPYTTPWDSTPSCAEIANVLARLVFNGALPLGDVTDIWGEHHAAEPEQQRQIRVGADRCA
jgi:hypothetical protein